MKEKSFLKEFALKILPLLLIFASLAFSHDINEAFIFLSALLVHEMAHLSVAAALGLGSETKAFFLFGQAMISENSTPGKEMLLYGAGITANLIFAAAAYTVSLFWEFNNFEMIVFYNLVFAAANLIPAYPMDCARILTALLKTKRTGVQSVRAIGILSNIVAFVMFALGSYIFIFINDNILLMLLTVLICFATQKENERAVSDYLYSVVKK